MIEARRLCHELLEHFRSRTSRNKIDMALVLTALESLGDEIALIEQQLQGGSSSDTSTAVSSALSTAEVSASTALSTALSNTQIETDAKVASAISDTEAQDQAQVDQVTSSLSNALSTVASLAGVSSSLSGASSSVSEVSTSLSASSTSISTISTSLPPAGLTVSPNPVSIAVGQTGSVALSISGGSPPYNIDGLGIGQQFDPTTNTLNFDGTATAGQGDATVVDSSSPPLTTPITIETT